MNIVNILIGYLSIKLVKFNITEDDVLVKLVIIFDKNKELKYNLEYIKCDIKYDKKDNNNDNDINKIITNDKLLIEHPYYKLDRITYNYNLHYIIYGYCRHNTRL